VVQAGNATLSSIDRAALQAEINELTAANLRVSTDTQFNGIKVLASNFRSQFQIGEAAGDVLDVKYGALFPTAVSNSLVERDIEQVTLSGQPTGSLAANSLTLNGAAVGASVAGASAGQSADSAYAVAAAITAAGAGLPNVISATATNVTSGNAGGAAAIGAGALVINGTAIGAINGGSAAGTAAAAAAAITGASGTTGVTASAAGNVLTLTAADGRNIVISETVGGTAAQLGLATGTRRGTITVTNTADPSNTTIVVGGAAPGVAGLAAGSYASAATGLTATVQQSASGYLDPHVDVSTLQGVEEALVYLDKKIDFVSSLRSLLGANQQRIEHAIQGINNRSESLGAARSRVVDADYAHESSQLLRRRILQEAGNAMLAQANTETRRALILLR